MTVKNQQITMGLEAASGELSAALRTQLSLLVATPVGTVPLDRDFGIDTSCVDLPPQVARSLLAGELADKIERYIPGLALKEVRLESLLPAGTLELKVVVEHG